MIPPRPIPNDLLLPTMSHLPKFSEALKIAPLVCDQRLGGTYPTLNPDQTETVLLAWERRNLPSRVLGINFVASVNWLLRSDPRILPRKGTFESTLCESSAGGCAGDSHEVCGKAAAGQQTRKEEIYSV